MLILWALAFYSLANLPPYFDRVKTKIQDPMGLRDPFKRTLPRVKTVSKPERKPAQDTDKPNLEKIPIDQITVVGILSGPERRALIKINTSPEEPIGAHVTPHMIKEGALLGPNKAEVRAILPAGIVLVEKVTNIYEQEEFLETIIPITQEASVSIGSNNSASNP